MTTTASPPVPPRPRSRTDASLVVLQSFPEPRPTTNPYLVMLGRRLRETDGLGVLTFSWRRALLGRYDVFHVHWPEILVSGHGPLKTAVRQALTLLLLLRLRAFRIPLVRTVHNVQLPDGLSRRQRALLALAERWTTARVRLNETTALPAGRPAATIPHGDYRDWFSGCPRSERRTGQLGYAGLIRRYKGVEQLLAAFADTAAEHPDLTLRVEGNPSSAELAAVVTAAGDADPRITARLAYLSDAQLVDVLTSSELVVLPYRFMHNSGGTLAALSVGTPVLVPDNEVNRQLAAEVGPGWVHVFDGDLTADDLVKTLARVRSEPRADAPDLSARDWSNAGARHLALYRAAVAARRPGRAS